MTKFCKRCHAETKRNKRGRCFICLSANQRKYYAKYLAHPLRPLEERRAHRREYVRRYRVKHKERARESGRISARKQRYGLTDTDFTAMLALQGGGCAICEATLNPKGKSTHVDHDHRTGKVRGLLCHRCNIQLPQTSALARAAAAYLSRYECLAA